VKIDTYVRQPVEFRPYDPLFPRAAAALVELVRSAAPELRVEHVGSTSIPGCAGKGVVDLAVLYPPGGLARARDVLDRLGCQRQTGPNAFPESRPMRRCALELEGRSYRAHLHVLEAGGAEEMELLTFRDRLRADPALCRAYEAEKRAVLARGITEGAAYAECKTGFVRGVLGT